MEKTKFLRKHLLFVFLFLILGACSNEDITEFEVHGDVMFVKILVDGEPVVGTAYYAYSNKILSSCTVSPPGADQNIDLAAYQTNTFLFAYEPSNGDFSSDSPNEGIYLFNAKSSDNESIEVSDEQSFSDLGFAQLDERTFDTIENWLHLTWGEVTGADSYKVSLIDTSGVTVFSGYAIKADSPECYISTLYDVGTWTKYPVYDDKYTIRIQCNIYDSDATEEDYAYSIQEISQKDYSIVWKLN
jgi:hypothetical protein